MEKRENIWQKSRTVIAPPGARATDGGAGPLYRSPASRWIDYCERELGVAVTPEARNRFTPPGTHKDRLQDVATRSSQRTLRWREVDSNFRFRATGLR